MDLFSILGFACVIIVILSSLLIGPYYSSVEQRNKHHKIIKILGSLAIIFFILGLL